MKKSYGRLATLVCLAMMLVLVITSVFAVTASAAEKTATLSFASKDQRTSFSTTKQVWEQNDITFTNEKGSSTNNVADYANPVRLYKSSKITIQAPGNIKKIVFYCSSGYVLSVSGASTSGTTVTVNLDASSDTYTVASLSAQVRFSKIDVTYVEAASACAHTNTTTTKVDATCTEDGKTIVSCNDCDYIKETTIKAPGHTYENGTCSVCGVKEPDGYKLVTSASDINVGDKIIIVAKDSDYALSTTQNNNNRGQVAIKKTDGKIVPVDGIQILTVEAGTVSGTFVFNTGSGYLYAASSSNNYLRTETTKSANSSWQITIASNGTATVVAKGSNTKNTMQYNKSSSLFSCYSTNQQAITIYKENIPTCDHEVKLDSAQVTIGNTLAMNYYVTACEHTDIADYAMNFTMNENTVTVTEATKAADGRYVFSFCGIAPQCMGDNIAAELVCGNDVISSKANYSVKENLLSVLAKDAQNATLAAIVYDTLTYGAAAQTYANYKTDALVTADVEGLIASETAPEKSDVKMNASTGDVSFNSAGVYFDYNNKIYVKLNAESIENVTLYVGETALTITEENGAYIAYSEAISATDFATVYTFTLKVNGETVQTLEYSVASYAFAKWNQNVDGNLTAMANLARALYRYGASAVAYKNS